jgi:hypothetical protein
MLVDSRTHVVLWNLAQFLYLLVEHDAILFCFLDCPSLALAGSSIVFVVVLKTEKSQIVNIVVLVIVIKVRYLSFLAPQVSVQAITNAAPSSAFFEDFDFR